MPFECNGGRSDKSGNRYEYRWVIYQLLKVLQEDNFWVKYEPCISDENRIDLLVCDKNENEISQQCKGRYGAKEQWDLSYLKTHKIIDAWKKHLAANNTNRVALVSPISFSYLEDLCHRARNASGYPELFFNEQIKDSDVKFVNFYKNLLAEFGFHADEESNMACFLDCLKRIDVRQFPDAEGKNIILEKCQILFRNKPEEAYDKFCSIVVMEDIWGQPLDTATVRSLCERHELKLRDLSLDGNVMANIKRLNEEFSRSFCAINGTIIDRDETTQCIKAALDGKAVVLHGKAGIGKSGCVEGIIQYCKIQKIPYLAIKLDKHFPTGNSKKWGEAMGFPGSIAFCIDAISKKQKALLILDQLDAIRWTNINCSEAIDICLKIFDEIKLLNEEREENIGIVVVSRTYDLYNDLALKKVFENDKWEKISVGALKPETIQRFVSYYPSLTTNLKELLKIPNNLYIWLQLKEKAETSSSFRLIERWWKQICQEAGAKGLTSEQCQTFIDNIMLYCKKHSCITVPKYAIEEHLKVRDYLVSSTFIIDSDREYSFVHQSIFDYLLAKDMLRDYYDGVKIIQLIGRKDKQTPEKRYQLLQFMQILAETNTNDFIRVGEELLNNSRIRFSFKCLCFEILADINSSEEMIGKFLLKMIETPKWRKHVLNTVIPRNKQFIRIIESAGYFEKLEAEGEHQTIAYWISNIAPRYNEYEVEYIRRMLNEGKANLYERLFYLQEIKDDTEEFFNLRIAAYLKGIAIGHHSLKESLRESEQRTVKILASILAETDQDVINNRQFFSDEAEFITDNAELDIKDYINVIELLYPVVASRASDIAKNERYHFYQHGGIERVCVQILKRALRQMAQENGPRFLAEYVQDIKMNFDKLSNEILLYSLLSMPEVEADSIFKIFISDIFIVFDETSGNGDKLLYAKQIVNRFADKCCPETLMRFEETVISFCDKDMIDDFKMRYEARKTKKDYDIKYWGEFQEQILSQLPDNLQSSIARGIVACSSRRPNRYSKYKYDNSIHGGCIVSPVSGKALKPRNWKEIITNRKIVQDNHFQSWKGKEGVESSVQEFSRSFSDVVKKNPYDYYTLLVDNARYVRSEFVDAFWSGISFNASLEQFSLLDFEKLVSIFGYDYESYRASSICNTFAKIDIGDSEKLLHVLADIAQNHKNPEPGCHNVIPSNDPKCETLESISSNAINSTRGQAAYAIGQILWNNTKAFNTLKNAIDILSKDKCDEVRYASLFALWPIYSINREWATERILSVYRSNPLFVGFRGTKDMLFILSDKHEKEVTQLACRGYECNDITSIREISYYIAESYILKNKFKKYVLFPRLQKEEALKCFIDMFGLYLSKEEKRKKANRILIHYLVNRRIRKRNDVWTCLFFNERLDPKGDAGLVRKLMKSSISRRELYLFSKFIEGNEREYSACILKIARTLLNDFPNKKFEWGIEEELVKLVLRVYEIASADKNKQMEKSCLDILDFMYQKNFGQAQALAKQMISG